MEASEGEVLCPVTRLGLRNPPLHHFSIVPHLQLMHPHQTLLDNFFTFPKYMIFRDGGRKTLLLGRHVSHILFLFFLITSSLKKKPSFLEQILFCL